MSAEAFFVSRTLQALEVVAFAPASAPQVAGALRVHPRTARRLLNRLVEDGWLTRRDGRRRTYAPTLRILALAAQFADRLPLARAAHPVVARLHDETGGVAHLVVPSYASVLCLVHRAGDVDERPALRELIPAHATAGGKALLAYRDHWRESVLASPLERFTPQTVVEPEALRAEAGRTRERGYATERAEYQEDVGGVAAPVRDDTGEVVAALALSSRLDDLEREAEPVRRGARELTAALGG